MTIKPWALETGQQIGIIAPAGPVDPEKLRPGLEILSNLGFKPVLGPHLFKKTGYLAGDDSSRLKDFHEMIKNENIKAVFCARGGYGSSRLLNRIDYDLIGRHPKIILGFSDITALLLSIWGKTGLITFHGPLATGLDKGLGNNITALMNLIGGRNDISIDLKPAGVYCSGQTEGFLIGGNLSLMVHLIGTPYLPSLDGGILFLEDKGEAPYRLDRMLTHLGLSGRIKNIKGLMLGNFLDCGTGEELRQVMDNCLSSMDIPIVHGCPFGHGDKNVTLPLGARVKLDTGKMILKVLESPVRKAE